MTEHIAQTLRPVGMLEKWSTARHNLSFYINVALTARYASSASSQLTKDTIYRALTALITTHAHLGATILGEDTAHPTFARLARINLDELVTITHLRAAAATPAAELAETDEILASQHNNKLRDLGRLPPWRVVIIAPRAPAPPARGVDVAFVFHHALGDGRSGLAFHRLLLRALNTPPGPGPAPGPVASVVVPPEMPLPPPVEGLAPLSTSVSKLWAQVWFPKAPGAGRWCGAPIQIPLKSLVQTVVLPAAVLAGLVAACRREGVTVTALLNAVLMRAFFAVLGEHEAQSLSASTAMDMRRFAPGAGDETMGVFVCSVAVTLERRAAAAADVWSVARQCRAVLQKAVEMGAKDTDTGLLKYLSDYDKYFLGKLGARRESALEVSNLGAFKSAPAGTGGEWGIGRLIFSQSSSVTGSAVTFSVVSVVGGEMCVSVSVQEGIVEEGVLAGAVGAFEAALVELAG